MTERVGQPLGVFIGILVPDLADKGGGFRHLRCQQCQGDTGDQADNDLRDQAQAFEGMQQS